MSLLSLEISSTFTTLLRYLPPEASHHLALRSLDIINFLGIKLIKDGTKKPPIHLFGREFKNRLGTAGGLDKDGEHINALSNLGLGFIEIGTVTPVSQLGNPKPRLFRDRKNLTLLNRMGFNNKGVHNLVENIKSSERDCHLMVSIGKNYFTANEDAFEDYLLCMKNVYEVSDMISINVSSPNTKNLRLLQQSNYLSHILQLLKEEQLKLSQRYGYKPLIVKISPDISERECNEIAEILNEQKIDGLITTNTTTDHNHSKGKGGLSGGLLFEKSTEVLRKMRKLLGKDFPIIASGGVMDESSYKAKLDSGADLVQIYTGMIYKGPALIQKILDIKD